MLLTGRASGAVRGAAAANGALQVLQGSKQAVEGNWWNTAGNIVMGTIGMAALKVSGGGRAGVSGTAVFKKTVPESNHAFLAKPSSNAVRSIILGKLDTLGRPAGVTAVLRLCTKFVETQLLPRRRKDFVDSSAINGKEFCDGESVRNLGRCLGAGL